MNSTDTLLHNQANWDAGYRFWDLEFEQSFPSTRIYSGDKCTSFSLHREAAVQFILPLIIAGTIYIQKA